MKKLKELLEKNWFAYTFAICCGVILFVVLTHMSGIGGVIEAIQEVVSPILCGIVMAYLMNPISNFFEYKWYKKIKSDKIRHSFAVVTTVIAVVLAFALLMIALIPSLIQSASILIQNAPTYLENLDATLDAYTAKYVKYGIDTNKFEDQILEKLTEMAKTIPENTGKILSTSASVGTSIFNLVVGFIIAIYMLSGKEGFKSGIARFRHAIMSDKAYAAHNAFWKKCHEILIRFIGFDIFEGIIVGLINAILMIIFRMPYISLISVIVGATNLLPTFGPIIGAIIGAFILVLVDPMAALIFLIFTCVIQLFDGYILKPKLFSGSLGVPAAWILISIVVGGKLFGAAGIVLAIPFAAIISFIYEELILPLLLKRKAKAAEKKEV